MSEHVLELEAGVKHADTLLPALRDYVASQPPGDTTLVVVATVAGGGRRTLRFGGLIAEPDRAELEAIVEEHRLTREGETEGSAGRTHD